MLVFQDVDQYLNHINLSNQSDLSLLDRQALSCNLTANYTNFTCDRALTEVYRNYWAFILVLFPIFTLFGNVLVILSVYRERTLQTATNYFIVSLALADLLVATVVMPFAVYVLVSTRPHFKFPYHTEEVTFGKLYLWLQHDKSTLLASLIASIFNKHGLVLTKIYTGLCQTLNR
nr:unnamed protein product [Callosobruchus analis]